MRPFSMTLTHFIESGGFAANPLGSTNNQSLIYSRRSTSTRRALMSTVTIQESDHNELHWPWFSFRVGANRKYVLFSRTTVLRLMSRKIYSTNVDAGVLSFGSGAHLIISQLCPSEWNKIIVGHIESVWIANIILWQKEIPSLAETRELETIFKRRLGQQLFYTLRLDFLSDSMFIELENRLITLEDAAEYKCQDLSGILSLEASFAKFRERFCTFLYMMKRLVGVGGYVCIFLPRVESCSLRSIDPKRLGCNPELPSGQHPPCRLPATSQTTQPSDRTLHYYFQNARSISDLYPYHRAFYSRDIRLGAIQQEVN